VAVDALGDRRAGVAAQIGELLIRQQRDEAVPQFTRCPVGGVEAGGFDDGPEGPQDVVPVELGSCPASEDKGALIGIALGLVLLVEDLDASGRKCQRASGLAGLGVAVSAD
jgi:hypothetical protein